MNRKRKVQEGLPGSKSVACMERSEQERGRPHLLREKAVRATNVIEGALMGYGESDHLIVSSRRKRG
jgi:hypothetical protein